MPTYRVVLAGDLEVHVEADTLNDLYRRIKSAAIENDKIKEVWIKMSVRKVLHTEEGDL